MTFKKLDDDNIEETQPIVFRFNKQMLLRQKQDLEKDLARINEILDGFKQQ